MMNITSMSGAITWMHVHAFFGLFAAVGFILLTVWAIRFLKKEQMIRLAVALLIVGIVGAVLTTSAGSYMMERMPFFGGTLQMRTAN